MDDPGAVLDDCSIADAPRAGMRESTNDPEMATK
jgi:hypothetical protein